MLFGLGILHAQEVPAKVLQIEGLLNKAATPEAFEADRLAARYEATQQLLKDSLTISVYYDLPKTQVVRVYNNLDMAQTWPQENPPLLVEITAAEVCTVRTIEPMSTGKYLLQTTCSVWKRGETGNLPLVNRSAMIPSPLIPDRLIGNFSMQVRSRFAAPPTIRNTTLPSLDWPPPLATAQGELPAKWFGNMSMEQHATRLEGALATYGYLKHFRYQLEQGDGQAILTAPERIHGDGSSFIEERFADFSPAQNFSLSRITESLRFFAKPGTYRVWLITIKEISPGEVEVSPFVYLFEVPEPSTANLDPDVQMVFGHRLSIQQHLDKAGWIRIFRGY